MARDVDWLEFEPAGLERARKEGRPVVLLLTVPWCRHCRELMETTFRNPEVVDLIESSFVAIHADAERRPDVNDRYGTGGWPTIAFLTPEGDLIANEKYCTADELAALLRKVREFYNQNRHEIEKGLEELWNHKLANRDAAMRGKLSMGIVDDVTDAIYEKFDARFGGWGQGSSSASCGESGE